MAEHVSTHAAEEDARNERILIYVNGRIVPKAEAVVSVYDSGFMLGDGVWEGLRLHRGKFAFLEAHLDRLYEGAKAIMMDVGLTREELIQRLDETIDANAMRGEQGVHIRLMVTRGIRSTPYQDPRVVISPATIVAIDTRATGATGCDTGDLRGPTDGHAGRGQDEAYEGTALQDVQPVGAADWRPPSGV